MKSCNSQPISSKFDHSETFLKFSKYIIDLKIKGNKIDSFKKKNRENTTKL